MKIVFQCVGFAVNPVFLDRGDEKPLPYGTIIDMHDDVRYWQENYMPDQVTEEDVRNEYKVQLLGYVKQNFDVSNNAWLDNKFGEPIKR